MGTRRHLFELTERLNSRKGERLQVYPAVWYRMALTIVSHLNMISLPGKLYKIPCPRFTKVDYGSAIECPSE